jgi:SAM-dependent methyltransferase
MNNARSRGRDLPLSSHFERLCALINEPLQRLDLERLGQHNKAYSRRYSADRLARFVVAEWPYYAKVLGWYLKHVPRGSLVLEIGMFIPVMPLLLSMEGYRVTTIERLELFGGALDPMVELVEKQGVRFLDDDIMTASLPQGHFQAVNLLCVVEHLLGSPKRLLLQIHRALAEGGALLFAVPNQARLQRRVGLFLGGRSVHPSFEDYFDSEYPFEGHHREYVRAEVTYALAAAGFHVDEIKSVRYPPRGTLLERVIIAIANVLPASFHQLIFAVGRKDSARQISR